MITNDNNIMKFRHKVYEEICKLAFANNLNDESIENLVQELIPGQKPSYRCCVYKEREIVRQRIRLAMNKDVSENNLHSGNIVQVIDAACDECPISSYSVTSNCRFCLGRPCKENCKFGAISEGEVRMHIEPKKCKECGMCAKACPFQAIVHLERPCKRSCPVDAISYDEDGICRIKNDVCIRCGHCIHSCPFGAIASKTDLVDVIKAILSDKKVIAMCAPASIGQFGENINLNAIREALKKVGFDDMVDVSLGGDLTAYFESKEWMEAKAEGKKLTTSCCPAFVNMIKNQFEDIYDSNMSKTVSPMCAVSRMLKYQYKDCITVFIGPCIAKKSEAHEHNIKGNADYVLSFGEMAAMLRAKNIKLEEVSEDIQVASLYGKNFAVSGGVSEAVLQCIKEQNQNVDDITYIKASGGSECKKCLLLLKAGKLQEDFIEGMVCEGGCIGGPSKHLSENEVRKSREILLSKVDNRGVGENLQNYPIDKFLMSRND
ncbi:MAG: 4Fe-4S dicluster domain-containing protein [Lachnospiraceae bacterium]|nr:4Fe-4S dicluster domain-containing protein [Lachnospiraceae bacterium]